ncbi:hypothetical protein [Lunatibacter salilacus]|nr:hypothetical protein [Lunatibacter salilacus]
MTYRGFLAGGMAISPTHSWQSLKVQSISAVGNTWHDGSQGRPESINL